MNSSSALRVRLEAALPVLLFLFLIGLSGAAGLWKHREVQSDAQAQVEFSTQRISADVSRRFTQVLYGLNGARGVYAASESVNRAAFRAYVESRDLPKEFPGVRGFGFVQRVQRLDLDAFLRAERADGAPQFTLRQLSDTAQQDLLIVKFIEPAAINQGAMGLDIGSEPLRRSAAERAIDSGQATMTAPVMLVQHEHKTPGVLVYVPVYAKGSHPSTVAERRAALLGLLYSPIVIDELLKDISEIATGLMDIEVFDSTPGAPATLIYDPDDDPDKHGAKPEDLVAPDTDHLLSTNQSMSLMGRELSVRVNSEPKFDATLDRRSPWRIAVGGAVLAALLALYLRDRLRQLVIVSALVRSRTAELERIARYDSLTKLPNRALLGERLEQALVQTRRRGQHLAVVFIDLDGFKAVNDNHGHEAGDYLLITLAQRMTEALRDGDILARLGGDEFVAVLLDLSDVAATAPMLNRLLAAASQPVQYGQARMQVSASLGVTFYSQAQGQAEDLEADQLMRQADQAMYQAKQAGKNRFCVFDPVQDLSVRSHHENMESVRRALANQELVLEYQPKVNLRTGAVIGVEALIRWQHPQRGLLPPADFLPMIQDHTLAIEVGQWVIENALLQVERWQQDGLNIAVSVNIGVRHLMQADFVQRLREALDAHPRLKPDCLELELLETSALKDLAHVSQVIQACRSMGVECTLDDFGSGQSSLTCLKRLPVKYLKIDQNFISDMLASSDSLLILIGVLKLASAFDLQVIAEGVETAQHGFMLLELGCELAQGYGIARPMPPDELPAWVKRWKPDPIWSDVQSVSH
ncbi:MAG: EAL domain-containing protein [Burkholderiales bacterium]|nr:EAL domain-containing protein [Burkholderiales bacterium]